MPFVYMERRRPAGIKHAMSYFSSFYLTLVNGEKQTQK